jgi:hypothetical protein
MAQHTSRQRAHLLTCKAYLEAMRTQGLENSITRRAADPTAFAKPSKSDQADSTEKRKVIQKMLDFPMAIRIQALALAEASISYDRIREITGMETRLLDRLRKNARDRGYDPSTSMQMKDDYVADPVDKGHSKPKKQRVNGNVQNRVGQASVAQAIPGYVQSNTNSLPPGTWNFVSTPQL